MTEINQEQELKIASQTIVQSKFSIIISRYMISYKKKSEGEEKAYIEAKTALQCKEETFSKKLK